MNGGVPYPVNGGGHHYNGGGATTPRPVDRQNLSPTASSLSGKNKLILIILRV